MPEDQASDEAALFPSGEGTPATSAADTSDAAADDPSALAADTLEALHARTEGEDDEVRRGTVARVPP